MGGDDHRWDDMRAVHGALRAHELELNRATAAFEHAVIAPLTVVNGGAAAAWLAFLGSGSRSDSGEWAVLFWGGGLLAAIVAGYVGWRRQRAYSQAERFRREAFELLWLESGAPDWRHLTQVVSRVAFEKREWDSAAELWQDALLDGDRSIERARRFSYSFQSSVAVSAVLFVIGTAWAAASLS